MKKNKKIILFVLLFVALIAVISVFLILNAKESYKLSNSENRWIESNKNDVLDISVLNNIPIFSDNQDGLFFSFLDFFEKNTKLELNKISYNFGSKPSTIDYSFKLVNEKDDVNRNELLIYKDNFSVLSIKNNKLNSFSDLYNKKIGVFTEHLNSINEYISPTGKITYVPFENISLIIEDLISEELDYIIIPKNQYLDKIVDNELYVSHTLSALYNKYVITLSEKNETLNSIIEKKFNEWKKLKYDEVYHNNMNDLYFSSNKFDEKDVAVFKGKTYIYGYVENKPYDFYKNSKLNGINYEFLSGFENFANINFQYKKFNSIKDLEKAFNENKVDLVFDYYAFNNLSSVNETVDVFSSNYVILSNINSNIFIDSFASLKNKDIYTLKDTKISNYINTSSNAIVKAYSNIDSLLKNKDPLILVDINMYNFYKNTKLKDYYVVYQDNANFGYGFLVKRNDANTIFFNFFQYYLSNINTGEFINNGIANSIHLNSFIFFYYIYYVLIFLVVSLFAIIISKKRKLKTKLKKEKTRYIDCMTSLKNRNYLVDNIDNWDDDKTFPKAIMIVDLNSIKDINSNYGYDEGDKVIKSAANILFSSQLEKTDIMRTDGNEFLIYMVGYKEAEVIAYMRKVYKLMKDLPYEYGAAIGYSMINDDIKLIEDAINEAVLEMKTNKELKSNE